MSDDHVEIDPEKEHFDHTRVDNNTENGRCLNGRCHSSYALNSCSYRYQGMEAAQSHLNIYNAKNVHPSNHLGQQRKKREVIIAALSKSGTRRVINISGKWFEDSNAVVREAPLPKTKKGEIYENYKNDSKVIRKSFYFLNFTVGKVPYSNQVHHVLNQSSFNKIFNSLENIKDAVEMLLLKEFYNINHKENMIILPMDDKYARITGLPKHGGHPKYNKRIIKEVKQAFKEVIDIDGKSPEECGKLEVESIKKKLVKISNKWYKKIHKVIPKNKKLRVASQHQATHIDRVK